MDISSVKKISFFINTVILVLVFGLMAFFKICEATFLVYFSIPTAFVYILGYFLIHKGKLNIYVRMVYLWLTLYMGITTICLGTSCGFHLYSFSMIPIIFISEYISYKLGSHGVKSLYVSIIVALFFLICTGYVSFRGSVYQMDQNVASVFRISNAMIVLGFLIFYGNFLIRSIINSEEKLKEMAHIDSLTGLYNRHYMVGFLDSLIKGSSQGQLAIADLDDFKKINDIYGHNAGDTVLKTVSDKMNDVCKNCTIARWGGEEFLIFLPYPIDEAHAMLESMRSRICSEPVEFEGTKISISLTIGLSKRDNEQSIDEWTKSVDEKLYIGKKNGKNTIVE